MIPRSLLLLNRLKNKALIRQLWRAVQTPKGAIVFAVCVLGFSAIAIPNLVAAFFSSADKLVMVDRYANYVPIMLLAFVAFSLISSVGTEGLYFFPEEVENLFPAPYSRRELLAYKLFAVMRMSLVMGLFTICGLGLFFANPMCAFVGIVLTYLFASIVPIVLTLLGQIGTEHLFNRKRKLIAFSLLGLIAFASAQSATNLLETGFEQLESNSVSSTAVSTALTQVDHWVADTSESTLGKIVLAPFDVFAQTMFAKSLNFRFLGNAGIALGINLMIMFLILRLDANYLGVVEKTSKKIADIQSRARSTGGVGWKSKSEYTRSVPMLPFWKGMGPIVWRQCLVTFRLAKGYVLIGLVMMIVMGIPIAMESKKSFWTNPAIPAVVLVGMGYITLFFSIAAPVGFRPDIQRMEVFKSLPMGSVPIAMGQLLGSVIILSLIQMTILVIFCCILPHWIKIWAGGFVSILPVNYLTLAIANTTILFLPVKASAGPKDLMAMGQGIISLGVLMLILVALALAICGVGFLIYFLTTSWVATIIAGVGVATIFCIAGSFLLVHAYRRFDISLHTPT